jgi:hypothetical protein
LRPLTGFEDRGIHQAFGRLPGCSERVDASLEPYESRTGRKHLSERRVGF